MTSAVSLLKTLLTPFPNNLNLKNQMRKLPNKSCREAVQKCLEFKGSNTFATFINGKYAVFSYGLHFPLFVKTLEGWLENSDRYSVTTSKHKNQLHPQTETKKLTTEELKNLIWN